jgi:hypothetical protein
VTVDTVTLKKRRTIMAVVNTLAVLTALAAIVGYFQFALVWALAVFVAALLVGFAAQIWFIAGLRGAGKGA